MTAKFDLLNECVMDSSHALSKIQAEFTCGENIFAVHEAMLIDGWSKSTKYLTIIEFGGNYGFLVFDIPVVSSEDNSNVNVDHLFPINRNFKINIDAGDNCTNLIVIYQNHQLAFELLQNDEKTKLFVSEFNNIIGISHELNVDSLDHGWLIKYKNKKTNMNDSDNQITDFSDMNPGQLVSKPPMVSGSTFAGRENVVRYQMSLKENDYTYVRPICVFVGTWNVNGQAPTVPLSDWINSDDESPDIFAIGFQELDLSKEAYLFNDSSREEEWLKCVRIGLKQRDENYNKIASVRLIGMLLIVFVKEKHYAYIRNVATQTVGTGIMNRMGNKGGVAIRFEFHSTSICFVNSHLAAHSEEVERRNQDYRDICSRMCFSKFLPPKTIKDHDQVYWLGDLNYRIELDSYTVKSLIEKENFHDLLICDQLKLNQRQGKIFEKYEEGIITFKPTYKYNTGTDDWDSSEKNRPPAWCDRILWRGSQISQISYRSHPKLKISDHKPVSALFSSKIRIIDITKYRKIHEEVMKKLDKLENEFLPHVMVDTTEVIFDDVHFLQSKCKSLTVANTGQVPVQFEFIKKLDDDSYCKDWLHIEPYMGFIMPGEKSDVQLEVYVDKRSASSLNFGDDKLYDILVLHLEGGKDIFITITGRYVRSCFGMSFDVLSRLKAPINEISEEEISKYIKNKGYGQNEAYEVPKEIWFLVDHLYRNGMKQQHLFEHPGLHSELLQIRDWLDSGVPEHIPGSVYSVAESLLVLLDSTPEPLIPYHLYYECLNASANYLACEQIIASLPNLNRRIFDYLCTFLQILLSHSADNKLDTKTIAMVFGTIFIRDACQSRSTKNTAQSVSTTHRFKVDQQNVDRKRANFLLHFLTRAN